jgi:hypothetical protein
MYFITELFTHVAVEHPFLVGLVAQHSNTLDVDWAVKEVAICVTKKEPGIVEVSPQARAHQQAGKQ